MRNHQSGVMLIEALIAILVFSLGILGVVGMQASAIGASRDAKYRTDAGMLANEIIGQMMASNRAVDISGAGDTVMKAAFQGTVTTDCSAVPPATPYCAWRNRVDATLPGVAANPPLVTITPGAIDLGAQPPVIQPNVVSIMVQWIAPKDAVAHHYNVTTLIPQTY